MFYPQPNTEDKSDAKQLEEKLREREEQIKQMEATLKEMTAKHEETAQQMNVCICLVVLHPLQYSIVHDAVAWCTDKV